MSIPSPRGAGRTTSLPRATEASGTPRRIRRARLARPEDRRDAARLRWGRARRRTVSSSVRTERPWITDGGLNAIVRVDPRTRRITPLPAAGVVRLRQPEHSGLRSPRHSLVHRAERHLRPPRPARREGASLPSPRGVGPTGSRNAVGRRLLRLARRQLSRPCGLDAFTARVLQPPTRDQGARRAWSDSSGRIWVSEWNAGQVAVYAPSTGRWREWRLPGASPMRVRRLRRRDGPVWLSDFGSNALVRFDPRTRPSPACRCRAHRRGEAAPRPAGEVWGAESGIDKIVVVRTR